MSRKGKEEEEHDQTAKRVVVVAAAVTAVAGALFAGWGICKLLTGSESSSNTDMVADEALPQHRLKSKTERRSSPLAKWSKPQKGCLKINTDASLRFPSNSFAIGGVFRDHEGVWKMGFAGRIPLCSIHEAELWAIREGLQLAWEYRCKNIEVETDSKDAYSKLNGEIKVSNDRELERTLIQDCKNLMETINWSVDLKLCLREANEVADYMAKSGHKLDFDIKMETYDKPPKGVVPRLNRDLQ